MQKYEANLENETTLPLPIVYHHTHTHNVFDILVLWALLQFRVTHFYWQ